MKKVINLLLILTFNFTFAQVEIERYDTVKTNQSFIKLLENDVETFNKYLNYFFKNDEKDRKPITANSIKYKFNQQDFDLNAEENSDVNLSFVNYIDNEGLLNIRLRKDPNIYRSLDNSPQIFPKKIYYHDGTTEIIQKNININSNFSTDLRPKKSITKIDAELVFSAIKNIDSINIIVKENQKSTINNFNFEVLRISDKSIILKTNAINLDIEDIQGITTTNKRISNNSSSTTSIHPDILSKTIAKFIEKLDNIISRSKADVKIEHAKFMEKYIKEIKILSDEVSQTFDNSSNEKYFTYTFGAPIKQLIMYYKDGMYEKKIPITLYNSQQQNYFINNDANNTLIYDLNFKLLKKIPKVYYSLNENFFESLDQYYFLDKKTLEMIPLKYYSLDVLSTNYAIVKEDNESKFELIDKNNKKIMTVDKYEFDKDFNLALLKSNNNYYIINKLSPAIIEVKNIDEIQYADKGYFIAKKNNKYGFLDQNGKVVVPFEYDDAKPFNDMVDLLPKDYLFAVQKNNKWGFVDKTNKTIIPFQYSKIGGPFSYGIAPVYIESTLGLINLKNEKLTKFINSNYSSSSNFGKREFSLSDGSYDYTGKKIKE